MNREMIKKAVRIMDTQAALAEACGVRQSHVSNWLHRDKRLPLERAFAIERATKGEVTAKQLCPDCFPEKSNEPKDPL